MHGHDDPDTGHTRDKAAATVAYERQGEASHGQEMDGDANIDEELEGEHYADSGGHEPLHIPVDLWGEAGHVDAWSRVHVHRPGPPR